MTIHKVMELRTSIRESLEYGFRNNTKNKHEHDINLIEYLGGNTHCTDPISRCPQTGLVENISLEELVTEFESQAELYRQSGGKGEKLFGHYVISLDENDRELTQSDWMLMASDYMKALNYTEETKWVAVLHSDTDNSHIHIFSCLVKDEIANGKYCSLVSNHESAKKGLHVMRRYEKKFGLRELENPENSFGKSYTKGELKGYKGIKAAKKADAAEVLRARFKQLRTESKGKLPDTFAELSVALKNKKVEIKASLNKDGTVRGLLYRQLDKSNAQWLSGTAVAKTLCTFPALIRQGVNYDAHRDNPFLNITSLTRGNGQFHVGIKVSSAQYKRIRINRPKLRVYNKQKNDENNLFAQFAFSLSKAKIQYKLMQAIMDFIQALFASNEELFDFYPTDDWVYEYEKIDSCSDIEAIEIDDLSDFVFKFRKATNWRNSDSTVYEMPNSKPKTCDKDKNYNSFYQYEAWDSSLTS